MLYLYALTSYDVEQSCPLVLLFITTSDIFYVHYIAYPLKGALSSKPLMEKARP